MYALNKKGEHREIDFFLIDDRYYGGNQEWAQKWMMNKGGCSAVCACEACISLAKDFPSARKLYPYDAANVNKKDFMEFFTTMFRYIYPGIGGLTSLPKFAGMLGNYISTTGVKADIDYLSGNASIEEAQNYLRQAIDEGLPVMYLLLSHRDKSFDDYEWHWFTVTGYTETATGMDVDFATWGLRHTFSLERAWDTGMAWRGGMVCLRPR